MYCGATPDQPFVRLEVDHVQARSLGGSEDMDNLVTSCRDCNVGKAGLEFPNRPAWLPEPAPPPVDSPSPSARLGPVRGRSADLFTPEQLAIIRRVQNRGAA